MLLKMLVENRLPVEYTYIYMTPVRDAKQDFSSFYYWGIRGWDIRGEAMGECQAFHPVWPQVINQPVCGRPEWVG